MNSPFSLLQAADGDALNSASRCSSPVAFGVMESAHVTPADLPALNWGNVIYIPPLVVPFS